MTESTGLHEKKPFRVGTSGWNYPHWKGVLYPERGSRAHWLEAYAERFDTVELNATFYRLPAPRTFEAWRRRTPEGFLWSLKASRYITHVKRLDDVLEPLNRFYAAAAALGRKLGPVLFQLPPSLAFDPELTETFLDLVPQTLRHAVEVRHPSWLTDRFFEALEARNVAFCISDTAGRYPYQEVVTADFVYLRLHGSRKLYASEYTEAELARWAAKLRAWDLPAYVYFDNDFHGYAVRNALRLRELLFEDL